MIMDCYYLTQEMKRNKYIKNKKKLIKQQREDKEIHSLHTKIKYYMPYQINNINNKSKQNINIIGNMNKDKRTEQYKRRRIKEKDYLIGMK